MSLDIAQTIIFPFIDTSEVILPADTLKGFSAINFNLSNIYDTGYQNPSSSFFTQHALIPDNFGQQNALAHLSPWISIIFIISLLLITLAKLVFGQRFTQILFSPFSLKRFNLIEKDWASIVNPFKNILLFNSILMIGIFVMLLLDRKAYIDFLPRGDFRFYGFIIVSIGLFFLFKSLFLNLIGVLVAKIQFSKQLLLYFALVLSIIGLVLFPLLAFAIYGSEEIREILLAIAAFFIFIFYVFQIYRWTQVALSIRGVFGIYFFSYLCTVEFLLPLILIKAYLLV